MKILLTGVTGYIGKRLLPILIQQGHSIVCAVRDKERVTIPNSFKSKVEIIELDFNIKESLSSIPLDIEIAYYLIHSMSNEKDYSDTELNSAKNFREAVSKTNIKQVIYLSGITNSKALSKHLQSRKNVECELAKGDYNFTCFKAGIIIGSGSASFEIIRDLTEKLPFMVAPKWINTLCQPIAITNVIEILTKALNNPICFNISIDIAGKEILSYKEMLYQFAKVRKLKRLIISIPVMTPRLSSYWLFFVCSTSFKLASALVESMKIEVVAKDNIKDYMEIELISYKQAIQNAFTKIQQNEVVSSWKDSNISGRMPFNISDYINIPSFGCFVDKRERKLKDIDKCLSKIWSIGGKTGWHYANWLWRLRGFMDKLIGGVGLRRGRTNTDSINPGDSLDFWRVIYANKDEKRLLLYAEMKLPGEAWLELKINDGVLIQQATFRPNGLSGRLYWFLIYPIHVLIFKGMAKAISS
ncbi:MAG: SDR family oxidoreductase [Marinifilaceae bacterium]|jgi:uncharacterized protein YbjT (DUF2867 family)|nr:SDR family oxidoreductase [Marinifilaceae bacterium]